MRLKLLSVILCCLGLLLAYFHIKLWLASEVDKREIHGLRLELENGRRVYASREANLKGNETKIIYVPPEGNISIEPKDPSKQLSEVVDIRVKNFGVGFNPGFVLSMAPLGLGLDIKWIYYNRLGLSTSIIYSRDYNLSPCAMLDYRLDRIKFIRNTEVTIGPCVGKYDMAGGLRYAW